MILAVVSVIECDGCGKVIALKNDEEWENYDSEWIDSLMHQYCADCKDEPEHLALIEADRKRIVQIVKTAEEKEIWADIIQ